MDKSGNPALGKSAIERIGELEATDRATIGGTIMKTVVLLAMVFLGAFLGWRMAANMAANINTILIGASIGGFGLAIVTVFVPKISPFTAPIYSLLQGLLLGAVSQVLNEVYEGIALQALLLTSGVFVSVLYLYATRMVRVTDKLRSVIIISTLGIGLYYLVAFVASLFGVAIPLIYDTGVWGIVFSLIVVFVAALNLLLDFAFIEKTDKAGAPKVFEWYGAFSLMITLIWLYIEILRLIAKARR